LLDYKCPNCGGNLVFDAVAGALVCDNCGSRYDPGQFQAVYQAGRPQAQAPAGADSASRAEGSTWPTGFGQYTCPSCGAAVVAEATAAAGSCPYCRSPVVMTAQVAGELAPDLVVPFKTTRDQAVEALRKLYLNKRLLPKVFAAQNFVDEVKGVYVPFWLFDFDTEIHERYIMRDVSRRRHGSTEHITTREYAAERAGRARFMGIPVDGSTNMPDPIMESVEPFDLSQSVLFRPSYLSGFLAERYDVDSNQAHARAHDRLTKSAGTLFRDTVTGHQTIKPAGSSVTVTKMAVHYALLPVWMLTTIWRDQRFTFAMNGQTGRLIGDLPLDRQAYWRWLGLLFSVSAVVAGGLAALAVAL
jgi:DNA-directed RNA polymerase subunit RPC12/RpoP